MAIWKILKSQEIFKTGFFRLRLDQCELPDGRVNPQYYVMEFLDWVNVVPLTKNREMVMVEQYRHAAGQSFLEIPGGSSDGPEESPQTAGQRELLEETGFTSNNWVYCGYHYPNPALQSNRMHTFLALDCERIAEPQLDAFEDLQVVTMPIQEIKNKLANGEITHSLIAASLSLALAKFEVLAHKSY